MQPRSLPSHQHERALRTAAPGKPRRCKALRRGPSCQHGKVHAHWHPTVAGVTQQRPNPPTRQPTNTYGCEWAGARADMDALLGKMMQDSSSEAMTPITMPVARVSATMPASAPRDTAAGGLPARRACMRWACRAGRGWSGRCAWSGSCRQHALQTTRSIFHVRTKYFSAAELRIS